MGLKHYLESLTLGGDPKGGKDRFDIDPKLYWKRVEELLSGERQYAFYYFALALSQEGLVFGAPSLEPREKRLVFAGQDLPRFWLDPLDQELSLQDLSYRYWWFALGCCYFLELQRIVLESALGRFEFKRGECWHDWEISMIAQEKKDLCLGFDWSRGGWSRLWGKLFEEDDSLWELASKGLSPYLLEPFPEGEIWGQAQFWLGSQSFKGSLEKDPDLGVWGLRWSFDEHRQKKLYFSSGNLFWEIPWTDSWPVSGVIVGERVPLDFIAQKLRQGAWWDRLIQVVHHQLLVWFQRDFEFFRTLWKPSRWQSWLKDQFVQDRDFVKGWYRVMGVPTLLTGWQSWSEIQESFSQQGEEPIVYLRSFQKTFPCETFWSEIVYLVEFGLEGFKEAFSECTFLDGTDILEPWYQSSVYRDRLQELPELKSVSEPKKRWIFLWRGEPWVTLTKRCKKGEGLEFCCELLGSWPHLYPPDKQRVLEQWELWNLLWRKARDYGWEDLPEGLEPVEAPGEYLVPEQDHGAIVLQGPWGHLSYFSGQEKQVEKWCSLGFQERSIFVIQAQEGWSEGEIKEAIDEALCQEIAERYSEWSLLWRSYRLKEEPHSLQELAWWGREYPLSLRQLRHLETLYGGTLEAGWSLEDDKQCVPWGLWLHYEEFSFLESYGLSLRHCPWIGPSPWRDPSSPSTTKGPFSAVQLLFRGGYGPRLELSPLNGECCFLELGELESLASWEEILKNLCLSEPVKEVAEQEDQELRESRERLGFSICVRDPDLSCPFPSLAWSRELPLDLAPWIEWDERLAQSYREGLGEAKLLSELRRSGAKGLWRLGANRFEWEPGWRWNAQGSRFGFFEEEGVLWLDRWWWNQWESFWDELYKDLKQRKLSLSQWAVTYPKERASLHPFSHIIDPIEWHIEVPLFSDETMVLAQLRKRNYFYYCPNPYYRSWLVCERAKGYWSFRDGVDLKEVEPLELSSEELSCLVPIEQMVGLEEECEKVSFVMEQGAILFPSGLPPLSFDFSICWERAGLEITLGWPRQRTSSRIDTFWTYKDQAFAQDSFWNRSGLMMRIEGFPLWRESKETLATFLEEAYSQLVESFVQDFSSSPRRQEILWRWLEAIEKGALREAPCLRELCLTKNLRGDALSWRDFEKSPRLLLVNRFDTTNPLSSIWLKHRGEQELVLRCFAKKTVLLEKEIVLKEEAHPGAQVRPEEEATLEGGVTLEDESLRANQLWGVWEQVYHLMLSVEKNPSRWSWKLVDEGVEPASYDRGKLKVLFSQSWFDKNLAQSPKETLSSWKIVCTSLVLDMVSQGAKRDLIERLSHWFSFEESGESRT